MKKAGEKIASVILLGCSLAVFVGCITPGGGRYVKNVQVHPRLKFSPPLSTYNIPLRIVIADSVSEKVTVIRGRGHVKITINNFRRAVAKLLGQTFAGNFKKVEVLPARKNKGAELYIANVSIDKTVAFMHFHTALFYDGKLINETKGKVGAPQRVIHTTVFTWKKVLADVTLKNSQENLERFAEKVSNWILLNEKLRDFWKKKSK